MSPRSEGSLGTSSFPVPVQDPQKSGGVLEARGQAAHRGLHLPAQGQGPGGLCGPVSTFKSKQGSHQAYVTDTGAKRVARFPPVRLNFPPRMRSQGGNPELAPAPLHH